MLGFTGWKIDGTTSMQRLLLFRHAKTERLQPGSRDLDRALTERGRHDAAAMGLYLARHGLAPNLALISPSARTRQTWDLLAATLHPSPAMTIESRIYEATSERLVEVVRQTQTPGGVIMILGHNPGLHDLALSLIGGGGGDGRERLQDGLPTSGLAVIDVPVAGWSELRSGTGVLERFVTPKMRET